MKTGSANFATALATATSSNLVNLVIAVEIDSSTTIFVSGAFADIDSPPMGTTYIQNVVGLTTTVPQLDFQDNTLSATQFNVTLSETASDDVTSFFYNNDAIGKEIIIKIGMAELDYDDFLTISSAFGVIIDKIEISKDLLTFELLCKDRMTSLLEAKFGLPYSYEVGIDYVDDNPLDSSQLGIDTGLNMAFAGDPDNLMNNADERVLLVMQADDELIGYASVGVSFDVDAYAPFLSSLRGIGGTTPANHTRLTWLYGGIAFYCDSLRALLHLLTTSAAGTNSKYDLGIDFAEAYPPSTWEQQHLYVQGLEFDDTQVDQETIERYGWKIFDRLEYEDETSLVIMMRNQQRVIDVITDYILEPNGLVLVQKNGKMSVVGSDIVDFIENFSEVYTFDEDSIFEITGIEFVDAYDSIERKNILEIAYNWVSGIFGSTLINIDLYQVPASPQTIADAPKNVQMHAIEDSVAADADETAAFQSLLKMRRAFKTLPGMFISVRAPFESCVVEVGDSVYLTHASIPNLATGSRGVTSAKCMVVGQNFNYGSGTFEHKLYFPLGTNFITLPLYDVDKVAEGSIDDTSLTVSTDETATTEAADAYYDNSSSNYTADIVMIRVRITEPAYGAGSTFETIKLKGSILSATPAIRRYQVWPYINFNPQGSAEIELDLYIAAEANTAADRIKIDWISTTATGSEIPTVELIGVWFINLN